MPAQQLLIQQLQLLGNDGLPLAAGRAFFYLTGTTTLLSPADLQDVDGDPYANPVIADSAGYIPQPYYNGPSQVKLVIRTPGGVTVSTIDPVFMGENVNADARTFQSFGVVTDAIIAADRTSATGTDNTSAIQSAFNWMAARDGRKLSMGEFTGAMLVNGTVTLNDANVDIDFGNVLAFKNASGSLFLFSLLRFRPMR